MWLLSKDALQSQDSNKPSQKISLNFSLALYVDLYRMDFVEAGRFQTIITTILLYDAYFGRLYHEVTAIALSSSFPIPIIPVTSDVFGVTATSWHSLASNITWC